MRISPDVARYAYVDRRGAPTVTVVERQTGAADDIALGQDPRWASSIELIFRPQDNGPLWMSKQRPDGWSLIGTSYVSGNSLAVAGSWIAVHRTDPVRIIEAGGQVFGGLAWPVYSDDGLILAALAPDYPHDRMQSVICISPSAGRRTIHEGAVSEGTLGTDFRMAGTSLCFREASGHVYGVSDLNNPAATPELLARPDEGVSHACPVYVVNRGLYVLHIRDAGNNVGRICLATWASMKAGRPLGWIIGSSSGGGYEHDARAANGETVFVAWMRPDGSADALLVNLTRAMVPLDADRPTPTPIATKPSGPKALGYFFGRRSKYGTFTPRETCAVLPLDAWQDSDGSHPSDVGEQLRASLRDVGIGLISNTAIPYVAVVEWPRVLGVFAGRQEGKVWVHEPASRDEALALVAETRQQMGHLPKRPVILLLREELSADRQFVGVADAIAPEIYFRTPEPTYERMLTAARARIAEVCRALAPSPLFLCVQAYDRNDDRWRQAPWALEAIQQAANEALALGQVLGLLWFAYARPGGVRAYPQLERWHVVQVDATVPPAPLPDPKPQPKPPEPRPEPPMPDQKPDLRIIPRDQVVSMFEALDGYLKANPRLGRTAGLLPSQGTIADRVDTLVAYGVNEALGAFQAEGPLPGDAAGYEARRRRALDHAVHVIERELGGSTGGGATDPQPPLPDGTINGKLRVVDGRLADDRGFVNYQAVSDFCLIGHALQGRKAEVHRLLDQGRGRARRVFCMLDPVNGAFGPVTRFTPDMPGWEDAADFVVHEAAFRGSRVELNIGADAQRLGDQGWRRQQVEKVARRYRDHPAVWFRLWNEARQNGYSEADDAKLLELAEVLRQILGHQDFAISDPMDDGSESGSPRQREMFERMAQYSNIMVSHPDRAESPGRERPVEHLKSVVETVRAVAPGKALIFDEPRGFAAARQPGRRDNRPAIAVADACTAAVLGAGYTYHRIAEQDAATPGLTESAFALQIPTSPDYRFENANTGNAWVREFSGFDKVRPCHNGTDGWAAAIGPQMGELRLASGWSIVGAQRFDSDGVVFVLYHGQRA